MKRFIGVIMLVAMAMCLCSCEKEMKPISAGGLNEGTYSIEVKSSSSMFRIIDCQLTVENGRMTAVMTLSGTGYEKLFPGTGEEANAASEGEFSYYTETQEGKYCYEIPVEALDKELPCAAFSIRKQKWYDRTLVFQSESLPDGALRFNPVPIIILAVGSAAILAAVVIIIVKCVRKRGRKRGK